MKRHQKDKSAPAKEKRKRIGDILIEAGLITQKNLEEALHIQKRKKKKLGQILMDLGLADEIEIAEALSTQLKLPFVRLTNETIPKDVLSIVKVDFAENYTLIPLKRENDRLVIAMANPLDFYALDDMRWLTGGEVAVVISPQSDILDAIDRHYPRPKLKETIEMDATNEMYFEPTQYKKKEEQTVQELKNIAETAPVVHFVNSIIADAIKLGASDIHIEPHKTAVLIRYRIDGIMREMMQAEKHVLTALISRIKVLSNMDITIRRKPQDGSIHAKFSKQSFDLRVSSLPTSYGEKITIRILNPKAGLMSFEEMGFSSENLTLLNDAIKRPQGVIVVTGPTGSGKSTTLLACLNKLNTPDVNIITVEDPVEYKIDGINQVQINQKAGITFASGLRSILRQDPDIVMVGEIRDSETAVIACQASQTGHLVLSTLHTNDAPSAIPRLMDLGVDSFVLTDSLVAIIAQRLIRRICSQCKEPNEPSEYLLKQIPASLIKDEEIMFYKGSGCDHCRFSGYSGRVGIHEMLVMTDSVRSIINPKISATEIKQVAFKETYKPLTIDGFSKALEGLTTVEEVFRIAPPTDTEFMEKLGMEKPLVVETTDIPETESEDVIPSVSHVTPNKILIVDDNSFMIGLLSNVLEAENFVAVSASNGKEALKLAFKEKPDLIVTDYVMPEMDGMSLVKNLKAELSTRIIPIIMLTAKDELESEVAMFDAGVDDYILKPVSAKRLIARINRLLSRETS